MLDDVAPPAASTLGAEQLFEPFVTKHQHRLGIEDELRFLGVDAALLQLLGLQQMQVVLLSVALDHLLRMSRAEQLPLFWAAVAMSCLRSGHPEADPKSP